MKRILLFTLVIGLFAVQADAGMWLSLNDGTTSVTIDDGGALDSNPLVGMITYIGPIGNWQASVTTGVSKPLIGGDASAALDLNSVMVTSMGAGQLTIGLMDTDFTLPPQNGPQWLLTSEFGGTTMGTIQLTQILDPDNKDLLGVDPVVPADGNPSNNVVLGHGPFGPGPFGDTQVSPALLSTAHFRLPK